LTASHRPTLSLFSLAHIKNFTTLLAVETPTDELSSSKHLSINKPVSKIQHTDVVQIIQKTSNIGAEKADYFIHQFWANWNDFYLFDYNDWVLKQTKRDQIRSH
jgi:hypothetical protein